MNDTLKKKFEFVRSDMKCEDFTELATLSDIESIACECIKTNHNPEGCNLLVSFGKVLVSSPGKLPERIKGFLLHLDDAERVLA